MKTSIIKSIQQSTPKETQTNDLHYLAFAGGAVNKFDWHIFSLFKNDKTVLSFWLGIVGKLKIDIKFLEVEPMDKDGAAAVAKNHFIERIKEIL